MVNFTAKGFMPPVFTPMTGDQTVDYEAIPPYINYMVKSNFKSVLVGGTTGEHMSLSMIDRKKVIDSWVRGGKSQGLHIQVQVGGGPLADVIELAKYCSTAGVDSLLTLPDLYFKPSNVDQLVFYISQVAKAAPNLPVLYYHIPSMSKVEINMPDFVRAATKSIPNFKGIKFTSNDLAEGAQVLRALEEGQQVFLGADTLIAPAALLGIRSSIGTSFNLFPSLVHSLMAAIDNKDLEKARQLQEKLSLAVEAFTVEGPWVPTLKAGMEIVTGLRMGPPALPLAPITPEAKKRIQNKLIKLDLA